MRLIAFLLCTLVATPLAAAEDPGATPGSGAVAVVVPTPAAPGVEPAAPPPAQTVVVQPVAPASSSLPVEAWILLFVTALGALRGIVHGVAELARFIARRTANTVDDRVADKLEQLDDLMGRIVAVLPPAPPPAGGTIIVTTMTQSIAPEDPLVPRDPEHGSVARSVIAPLAAVAVFALATLAAGGLAGCGASHRQEALKAAIVTADAAHAGWAAYDESRLQEIVAGATSLDDGRAKLAAYRAQQAKVAAAFTLCYQAIAAAALASDEGSAKAAADALARLQLELGATAPKEPQR